MAKQNKVAVNLAQDFTDTEKAQARANIGAGTSNTSIVHDSNTLPPVITSVNQMTIFNDGRTRFDNNYNGVIPTEPGQSNAGNVLVANYAGSPAKGTGVWTNIHEVGIREVPNATSADAGKALILNAQGEPIWDDVGVPTIRSNVAFTRGTPSGASVDWTSPTVHSPDDTQWSMLSYNIYVGGILPTESWDVKNNGSNWTTGIYGNFSSYICMIPPTTGVTFTVTTPVTVDAVRFSYMIHQYYV